MGRRVLVAGRLTPDRSRIRALGRGGVHDHLWDYRPPPALLRRARVMGQVRLLRRVALQVALMDLGNRRDEE